MAEKKLKPMNHKMFWNWDHSTNWCLNTIGRQNSGVANLYTKRPEEFEQDYFRMIDWCALHGIDAVGVVGLLRDAHGGLGSAQKICRHGVEKGVRVYIIAGLYTYGGMWYEGDNFLSLDRFLAQNPECMARDLDGSPRYIDFQVPFGWKKTPMACPSNPKVRNYVLDTLAYLFMMIPELGGIQMESGDCTPVCMCEACRARRAAMKGGERRVPQFSLSDMADIYPEATEVIRSINKDAWIICEMYGHPLNNPAFYDASTPAMQKLLTLPEDVFMQWSDRVLTPEMLKGDTRMPESLRKYRHIQRFHYGTQWDGGRHALVADQIRELVRFSSRYGMTDLSMFGESSAFHVNKETNYLAMVYFGDHPDRTLKDFADDVLAELWGGRELARKYLDFGFRSRTPELIPAALTEIVKILPKLHGFDQLRRWNYLASFLHSYYWEFQQSDPAKAGEAVNLDFLKGSDSNA